MQLWSDGTEEQGRHQHFSPLHLAAKPASLRVQCWRDGIRETWLHLASEVCCGEILNGCQGWCGCLGMCIGCRRLGGRGWLSYLLETPWVAIGELPRSTVNPGLRVMSMFLLLHQGTVVETGKASLAQATSKLLKVATHSMQASRETVVETKQ
jgi:hypothetical protein